MKGPRGKRAAMVAAQANSAVNRGALATDPRLEMSAKKEEKQRDDPFALTVSGRMERLAHIKGRVKLPLAFGGILPGKKVAAAHSSADGNTKDRLAKSTSDLEKVEDRKTKDRLVKSATDRKSLEKVNSAVNRKSLEKDPRAAFQRRSMSDRDLSSRSLEKNPRAALQRRSMSDLDDISSSHASHYSGDAARRRITIGSTSDSSSKADFISSMLVESATESVSQHSSSGQQDEEKLCDGLSDLVNLLSEMGFPENRVENVIDEMRKSGSNVDADTVLGVLLCGGGGEGGNPKPRGGHRSQSITEGSNRNLAGALPRDRSNRNTVFSSKPKPQDHEEESLSIEITPGQYAKLLKGRMTWDAMHRGTALSAVCIVCNETLRCTPEAGYVLCPDCNVVSSLGNGRHIGAVGLGYKRS